MMFSKISFFGLLTSAVAIQLGVHSEVTDPQHVDVENQNQPMTGNQRGLSMKHVLGGVIGGLCIGAAITAGIFVATDKDDNNNGGSGNSASSAKGQLEVFTAVKLDGFDCQSEDFALGATDERYCIQYGNANSLDTNMDNCRGPYKVMCWLDPVSGEWIGYQDGKYPAWPKPDDDVNDDDDK